MPWSRAADSCGEPAENVARGERPGRRIPVRSFRDDIFVMNGSTSIEPFIASEVTFRQTERDWSCRTDFIARASKIPVASMIEVRGAAYARNVLHAAKPV